MKLRTFVLVGLCVVSIPGSAVAYFMHRDFTMPAPELTPRAHSDGKPAVGDYQYDILSTITRDYVAQHADATAAMRKGRALAPVEFLNAQLEQRGERWRVRDVEGIVANTYDVM